MVSIHAPARGATLFWGTRFRPSMVFQSTHPHGVRLHHPGRAVPLAEFQSTHPHGVRRVVALVLGLEREVSIHAPARGATNASRRACCLTGCFNPRTRTGCDALWVRFRPRQIWFQSTHPHGVRRAVPECGVQSLLFQSTHPHGVRPATTRRSRLRLSFNPRTRTGCDGSCLGHQPGEQVSIHAPARGATPPRRARRAARGSFNPRTRTGCDSIGAPSAYLMHEFQSTHPHGVRPRLRRYRGRVLCFNPRTRTGCDGRGRARRCQLAPVSIHAPARGATRLRHPLGEPYAVSIHAPARGATARLLGLADGTRSFNPRTRTGCDEPTRARAVELAEFQSTHPHGVRLAWLQFRPPCPCFNPRTRTGCDHKEFRRALVESCFNPRTRTGCDLLGASISRLGGWFQSTHPHGVRLSHYAIRSGSEQTSIHFFKVREANRAR